MFQVDEFHISGGVQDHSLSPDKRLQRHPFLVAEETSKAAEKDTAESAVPGNGSGMWAGFPGMAHKKS